MSKQKRRQPPALNVSWDVPPAEAADGSFSLMLDVSVTGHWPTGRPDAVVVTVSEAGQRLINESLDFQNGQAQLPIVGLVAGRHYSVVATTGGRTTRTLIVTPRPKSANAKAAETNREAADAFCAFATLKVAEANLDSLRPRPTNLLIQKARKVDGDISKYTITITTLSKESKNGADRVVGVSNAALSISDDIGGQWQVAAGTNGVSVFQIEVREERELTISVVGTEVVERVKLTGPAIPGAESAWRHRLLMCLLCLAAVAFLVIGKAAQLFFLGWFSLTVFYFVIFCSVAATIMKLVGKEKTAEIWQHVLFFFGFSVDEERERELLADKTKPVADNSDNRRWRTLVGMAAITFLVALSYPVKPLVPIREIGASVKDATVDLIGTNTIRKTGSLRDKFLYGDNIPTRVQQERAAKKLTSALVIQKPLGFFKPSWFFWKSLGMYVLAILLYFPFAFGDDVSRGIGRFVENKRKKMEESKAAAMTVASKAGEISSAAPSAKKEFTFGKFLTWDILTEIGLSFIEMLGKLVKRKIFA